ncbi:MAG TPA: ribosome biogenesis GTPase Der [Myxococcaceae bacterium]|nr:ribosome biogenesis GTPase Der [Myxococcaceae bacterium]
MTPKPLVALVGRPNVGKSTLFNRLAGRRLALVEDTPGVTRDRQYADVDWGGRVFTIIDTGGFVPGEKDPLLSAVREQAQLAVEECEVIIFVVDGRAGITGADREVATILRRSGKPIILAANKVDSAKEEDRAPLADFYGMGLGDLRAVSAEHGRGVEELVDALLECLPELQQEEERQGEPEADGKIRLAVIGRPNVGKSTLINALLGKKRLVASEVAGTTRDAIDAELEQDGVTFVLTDTAGMRRKKTLAQTLEKYAVVSALRAVDRAEVAVLVIDAMEPAVDQDAKLAGLTEDKGRALVIVVNKWDRVPKEEAKQEDLRTELKYQLRFVAHAPVVFTSALTGQKVKKVLEVARAVHREFHTRAPTSRLNRLLEDIQDAPGVPISGGKRLRLYYIAQVSTAPPAFAITCNRPEGVPLRYQRFITNQIRNAFGLRVPIRLFFRPRPGAEKRESRKKVFLLEQKKPRRRG